MTVRMKVAIRSGYETHGIAVSIGLVRRPALLPRDLPCDRRDDQDGDDPDDSGRTVESANVPEKGTVRVVFDDKSVVDVLDSSAHYESYQLNLAGREIVV
jgi:hypothetical protein